MEWGMELFLGNQCFCLILRQNHYLHLYTHSYFGCQFETVTQVDYQIKLQILTYCIGTEFVSEIWLDHILNYVLYENSQS